MDSTSAIPAYAGGVLHQLNPPTTGSQKCDGCGGWIMGILSYIDEGKRYCPACWAAREKEKEGWTVNNMTGGYNYHNEDGTFITAKEAAKLSASNDSGIR